MRVLLFGIIADKAGVRELEVHAADTAALRRSLMQRIPELDRLSFAVAVDRTILSGDRPLTGAEEIALLPPFAGG